MSIDIIIPEEFDSSYVVPVFDTSINNATHASYCSIINNTLHKILIDENSTQNFEDFLRNIDKNAPFLHCESHANALPFNLSFYLLCPHRLNSFKFFYDMITRWLIPGKLLNAHLFSALDFRMPIINDKTYSVGELMVLIENASDLKAIQHNLPIIEAEIRLGVSSEYYAKRILEVKGLTSDEKTATIQEHIIKLLNRRPQDFNYDIFTEMQHVLVMCRDDFKKIRDSRHISRIIIAHYLFRRSLRQALQSKPGKRHLNIKLIRTRLHCSDKIQHVLGIAIAMNFLADNEVFEERHLLMAIQHYYPDIYAIKNSFFANFSRTDSICTMYLEVAKNDGSNFKLEEVKDIGKRLPADLGNRIEHVIHPIFMPPNEEEILRNIVTLSNQLKYVRDIPQVIISFREQKHKTLVFTVILARILKNGHETIRALFKKSDTFLKFIADRIKGVGMVRKKYKKECIVFKVELKKEHFLRSDHSLDLPKARQVIVSELSHIVGNFRDFNGGIISKQNELLRFLRESLLTTIGKQNELMLENFFYSLTPAIARTLLDPPPLETLFLMICEAIETCIFTGNTHSTNIHEDNDAIYVTITTSDGATLRENINTIIDSLQFPSMQLISSFVNSSGTSYLGYIFRSNDAKKRLSFLETIRSAIV